MSFAHTVVIACRTPIETSPLPAKKSAKRSDDIGFLKSNHAPTTQATTETKPSQTQGSRRKNRPVLTPNGNRKWSVHLCREGLSICATRANGPEPYQPGPMAHDYRKGLAICATRANGQDPYQPGPTAQVRVITEKVCPFAHVHRFPRWFPVDAKRSVLLSTGPAAQVRVITEKVWPFVPRGPTARVHDGIIPKGLKARPIVPQWCAPTGSMQRGLSICARTSFSQMVSGRCEKVCPFVQEPYQPRPASQVRVITEKVCPFAHVHRFPRWFPVDAKRSVLLSTSDPRVAVFLYLSSIH
jgi:hypothetical protein